MNHYYYVPVASDLVSHNGISLKEHLRVIDEELLKRNEVESSFEEFDAVEIDHIVSTKRMYKEMLLPERLIIVESEDYGMYELASMNQVEASSMEYLALYEISGFDIIDIFECYPEYKECAFNFFDAYTTKMDEASKKGKSGSKTEKIFMIRKIADFFKGKTTK